MVSRRVALKGLTALTGTTLTSLAFASEVSAQQSTAPTPDKIVDRFAPLHPANVRLQGWLGDRAQKNERNRLLRKDESDLLRGFQQRPGKQAWVGEHVGKWLHAATLAWVYTGDLELRAKLDRVISALIVTQQPDGYLGTYANGAHFAMGKEEQWDVWVHKYNLIGLLTYSTYTGNLAALEAAKRIGNLLVTTFGTGGTLDLNERSAHVGMASGSLLEPIVLLARATGDPRYLDFARQLVDKWEAPNGPKLVSALSAGTSVKNTANAKAYEMLACLVGLCELYRTTGEPRYLNPVLNAWLDITANQLLPTGSGSSQEHWTEARLFASDAQDKVAETCVTVSWIQLNQQLLRLTGLPKYADELEKSFYNHLAAAQRPDGAEWCYFTAHNGKKPYKAEQNCCTSSGPRGWALLPTFAYQASTGASEDGIVINFFTPGTAYIKLKNGQTVTVRQETNYPHDGRLKITVAVAEPVKFSLRIRVPTWSSLAGLKSRSGDYWLLRQTWSKTQTITLDLTLPIRVLPGEGKNAGRVALARGPVVLALDEALNPGLTPFTSLALASPRPTLAPHASLRDADGNPVYETAALLAQETASHRRGDRVTLKLVAFAAAGASGKDYAIWLGAPLGTLPS